MPTPQVDEMYVDYIDNRSIYRSYMTDDELSIPDILDMPRLPTVVPPPDSLAVDVRHRRELFEQLINIPPVPYPSNWTQRWENLRLGVTLNSNGEILSRSDSPSLTGLPAVKPKAITKETARKIRRLA